MYSSEGYPQFESSSVFSRNLTNFSFLVVHRYKGDIEIPNTLKTVLVLCKEETQLLEAGKNQKLQTEPRSEAPSMLFRPLVRIFTLDLDLEYKIRNACKILFGLTLMLISGKQDVREEDRIQSSEKDACKKCVKGEQEFIYGDLCE